ncbi:MAG: flagellar motor protein MotB [Planctomycetaceae bacterium]
MAMLEDDPPAGAPEWVVTYGDMMSLLLTFFIMLVSMSEMKDNSNGKLRAMMDSMTKSFGMIDGPSGVPGTSTQRTSALTHMHSTRDTSEGGTKKGGQKSKVGRAGPYANVQRLNHGTEVTLGGPTAFNRFDAELTEEIKSNLDIIASILAGRPNRIVVRGHTSSEPLPADSPYRDAIDLSFARAHQTSQYLISKGIRADYLIVSAVGDTEPRIISRDLELHRVNDRVDVFVIDAYITPPSLDDSK